MINTLTTEVWVHLSWFRFPSTIQLVQNQLITKQATFNDVNKTNWLKPITSTPTVFYFRQLSSSANITSLLGNINWTQIQQYMTKEAEFLSQTNRSESKKNRKQGWGRSFSSKQMKSNLRLPVTAQNVLIVLYSIIIGLGLVTNTAILLAFFKNKVSKVCFLQKQGEWDCLQKQGEWGFLKSLVFQNYWIQLLQQRTAKMLWNKTSRIWDSSRFFVTFEVIRVSQKWHIFDHFGKGIQKITT